MVVNVSADVGELEGTLNHAARRVTVVAENTCGQTAVVGADAHCSVEALALLHQWSEHLYIKQIAAASAFI